ncbi:MAG: tetratricopeptide repeat protein, partial [Planctomycetales bacterium]|nr:tetratricopeptide repeat protein [Planctomycetales bacterium]
TSRACFTTCLALQPQLPLAYFLRGICRLDQRDFKDAANDFDQVLSQGADRSVELAAQLNLALARIGLRQPQLAMESLDAAIDGGITATRVFFLRARLRRQLGDEAGADQDLAEGLRRTPEDEASWIARGVARVKDDPRGALSDFREALRINPASEPALQNMAHVLSGPMEQPADAIEPMSELVEHSPRAELAHANRGVLLARLGRREAAIADAEAAARAGDDPDVSYRIACIHALLVDDEHTETTRAIQWLARSLRDRSSLFRIALSDPDLAKIRQRPETRRLLEAAQVLLESR